MSKGKALVVAVVTAVAVIGWRFIESVISDGVDEPDAGVPAAGPSRPSSTAAPKSPPARKSPAVPEGATKAELYEIATELDIKGRSKMSKAELEKAIEQAS